jgi:hypothetical protein
LSKLKNKLEFAKSITAIAVADVKATTDAQKAADTEIRYLATSADDGCVKNHQKEIIICLLPMTFYAVAEMLEKKNCGM